MNAWAAEAAREPRSSVKHQRKASDEPTAAARRPGQRRARVATWPEARPAADDDPGPRRDLALPSLPPVVAAERPAAERSRSWAGEASSSRLASIAETSTINSAPLMPI